MNIWKFRGQEGFTVMKHLPRVMSLAGAKKDFWTVGHKTIVKFELGELVLRTSQQFNMYRGWVADWEIELVRKDELGKISSQRITPKAAFSYLSRTVEGFDYEPEAVSN